MLLHPFPPSTIDKNSKILILGSFPSIASRERGFYYAHPQNRFWKVLGTLFNDTSIFSNTSISPKSTKLSTKQYHQHIKIQKAFLQSHSIVLWDMVRCCEITGSSDASLKNVVFNDIFSLLQASPIRAIFLNGTKATTLFQRYCKNLGLLLKLKPHSHYKALIPTPSLPSAESAESLQTFLPQCATAIHIFSLPSTSPANARYSLKSLCDSWHIIRASLEAQ